MFSIRAFIVFSIMSLSGGCISIATASQFSPVLCESYIDSIKSENALFESNPNIQSANELDGKTAPLISGLENCPADIRGKALEDIMEGLKSQNQIVVAMAAVQISRFGAEAKIAIPLVVRKIKEYENSLAMGSGLDLNQILRPALSNISGEPQTRAFQYTELMVESDRSEPLPARAVIMTIDQIREMNAISLPFSGVPVDQVPYNELFR